MRLGTAFGTAQAVMALSGWALGLAFADIIRDADHWVAFGLLSAIGGRMTYEGLKRGGDGQRPPAPALAGWALLAAAVGTSIDAAATGVTLPLLGAPVLSVAVLIGAITLAMSMAGVVLGSVLGSMDGRRAETFGGRCSSGSALRLWWSTQG